MKRFQKEAEQKSRVELFLAVIAVILAIFSVLKVTGTIDLDSGTIGVNSSTYVLIGIVSAIFAISLIRSLIHDSLNKVRPVNAKLVSIEIIEEDFDNKLLEGYKFIFRGEDGKEYEWFDSERNRAEEGRTYLLAVKGNKILGVLESDGGYILFGEENVDEWRYAEEETEKRIERKRNERIERMKEEQETETQNEEQNEENTNG